MQKLPRTDLPSYFRASFEVLKAVCPVPQHSRRIIDSPPQAAVSNASVAVGCYNSNMPHEQEIDSIISQVKPWPEEDRVALAYLILRDMRKRTREDAPRQTLRHAHGMARGTSTPPDDATVRKWIDEHRGQKFG